MGIFTFKKSNLNWALLLLQYQISSGSFVAPIVCGNHIVLMFLSPGFGELIEYLPGWIRRYTMGRAQVPHRRNKLWWSRDRRLGSASADDVYQRLLLWWRNQCAFLQVCFTYWSVQNLHLVLLKNCPLYIFYSFPVYFIEYGSISDYLHWTIITCQRTDHSVRTKNTSQCYHHPITLKLSDNILMQT